MPVLPILGSTIFYRDGGAGVPLVFLHGNPTSSHVWRNVIANIDAPVRTIAPDLIGMGPVSYTHLTLPTILRV